MQSREELLAHQPGLPNHATNPRHRNFRCKFVFSPQLRAHQQYAFYQIRCSLPQNAHRHRIALFGKLADRRGKRRKIRTRCAVTQIDQFLNRLCSPQPPTASRIRVGSSRSSALSALRTACNPIQYPEPSSPKPRTPSAGAFASAIGCAANAV